jgi:hypothetical protein
LKNIDEIVHNYIDQLMKRSFGSTRLTLLEFVPVTISKMPAKKLVYRTTSTAATATIIDIHS